MAKKEIFVCDHCGKTSIDLTESSEPPYIQGWRYLNDFEFKASAPFRHQIIQKHFCSSACMLAHIEYFVKHQEGKLHEETAMPLQSVSNNRFLKPV